MLFIWERLYLEKHCAHCKELLMYGGILGSSFLPELGPFISVPEPNLYLQKPYLGDAQSFNLLHLYFAFSKATCCSDPQFHMCLFLKIRVYKRWRHCFRRSGDGGSSKAPKCQNVYKIWYLFPILWGEGLDRLATYQL